VIPTKAILAVQQVMVLTLGLMAHPEVVVQVEVVLVVPAQPIMPMSEGTVVQVGRIIGKQEIQ
jgi:hypothetical protein